MNIAFYAHFVASFLLHAHSCLLHDDNGNCRCSCSSQANQTTERVEKMHKLMTLKPGEGICIRNSTHPDHTVDKNLRHLQKHAKEEETCVCSATGLLNTHLAGGNTVRGEKKMHSCALRVIRTKKKSTNSHQPSAPSTSPLAVLCSP